MQTKVTLFFDFYFYFFSVVLWFLEVIVTYLWFCVWCPLKDVHKFPEMYPFIVISGFNSLHPLNSHPSHTSSLSSGSNLPRNGTQHLSLIYPRLLPKGFGESTDCTEVSERQRGFTSHTLTLLASECLILWLLKVLLASATGDDLLNTLHTGSSTPLPLSPDLLSSPFCSPTSSNPW